FLPDKLRKDAIRKYTEDATQSVANAIVEGRTQVRISDDEMIGRIVRENGDALWQRRIKGQFASGPTIRE
ncbi:MAG: hypothetical protein US60_C0034G0001, partial [Microgenomates group bacterium GW2011_GWC1_37_8]